MATIVCHQGLQSCLESQLVEPRALRLMLSSARPHFCQPLESFFVDSKTKEVEECCYEKVGKKTDFLHDKETSSNPDSGGWSFLQALSTNGPQSSKEIVEKENTYVHPLVKRSLSTLSEKSLELCTENLGNETGSDILEDNIFSLSSSDSESGNSPTRKQHKSGQLLRAKKAISRNFPPPLTTISGSESLQVRPHRENGRLVIKAVKAPSTNSTLFQAERSNGRLRLRFLKDSTPGFDYEEETTDRESEGSSEEDNKEEEEEEEFENDSNYEAEEEELEKEEDGAYSEEGIDGKRADVGAEMGTKKLQRRPGRGGRCKEGEHENKGLLNWEPLWVATS